MTKYIFIILSAFLFCSCDDNSINGSGHMQTEKRNVDHFDGIQTSGSIDIEVTNGDAGSIQLEADDNILPYIVTEVNDGLLDVYYKPGSSFNNAHTKLFVTASGLKKLYIKGSGNITSKNTIENSESIDTKITGSGDITADVDAPHVKAEIEGSGNLSLQGHCKNFEGSISGSGDLKCKKLLSENTKVNIAGSGTAHVFSSVHLNASTAGSGDIYYSGNPPSTQINKGGSGTIEAEN